MKVHVDPDICVGSRLCVETCPEVFEMDEEAGVARVKVDEVPSSLEQSVSEAEEGCPSGAIMVQE
jgi:ferredoxin